MATASAPDVFISYARDSAQKPAKALHRRLRKDGVSAFLDTHSLEHGDSIPDGVFDSLLGAKVLIAFADATYFTRRYCVGELTTALTAYQSVVAAGKRMAELQEALLPVVVALSHAGQRAAELQLLPLGLRETKWPLGNETAALAALVHERLGRVERTFRERLDGLGELDQVQDRLRESMVIPPPAALVGMPLYHETSLPGSIGDAFVGRGPELWELHTALASHQSQAAAVTTVLEGGGGFGKTRLALEYLHRYGADSYPGGVFWLNADVPADCLESQLHGILRVLRPETPDLRAYDDPDRDLRRELADALRERAASGRVLYVVDNVPEPEGARSPDDLGRYSPGQAHVSLLATSRARLTVLSGLHRVEVRELPEESAVRMLTAGVRGRRTISEEAWQDIAAWVGGLPLALELLNKLLVTHSMSPTELSQAQHEGRPAERVDRGMDTLRLLVPPGALRGITEALDVSYRRLPDDARLAARVLAWLSPDPIPLALLADESLFSAQVRGLLHTRSFVTEVSTGDVELFGRMHRVLADFLRAMSDDRPAELTWARAALGQILTGDAARDPARWPLLDAARPHAEAVLAQGPDATPEDPAGSGFLPLATGLVNFLATTGRIDAAAEWSRTCTETVRDALGEDHATTLTTRESFGDEHFLTLELTGVLGTALAARREYARAIEVLEPVVPALPRAIGPGHGLTL